LRLTELERRGEIDGQYALELSTFQRQEVDDARGRSLRSYNIVAIMIVSHAY
jgi:hypothetical protein